MRTLRWLLNLLFIFLVVQLCSSQVVMAPRPGSADTSHVQTPSGIAFQGEFNDLVKIFQAAASIAPLQLVTGNPISATGKIIMKQTLADGTLLNNSFDFSYWRDASGRQRTEYCIQFPGSDHKSRMVSVVDLEHRTMMDWIADSPSQMAAKGIITLRPNIQAPPKPPDRLPVAQNSGIVKLFMEASRDTQTQLEKLPAGRIAGWYVEGERTTRMLPAGSIGNDHDLQIVSEVWTSPELKIFLRRSMNDPRTGIEIVEMTNVDRAEPASDLFMPPAGYTIHEMPEAPVQK